jgi:hypothetical protein
LHIIFGISEITSGWLFNSIQSFRKQIFLLLVLFSGVARFVHNRWTRFLVFFLGDPHFLKCFHGGNK